MATLQNNTVLAEYEHYVESVTTLVRRTRDQLRSEGKRGIASQISQRSGIRIDTVKYILAEMTD